jgi:hypothetical protein
MSESPPAPATGLACEVLEDAPARLREALAILEAIEAGELLSELPPGQDAARRHQRAVSLLAILRRDLEAFSDDLGSALFVDRAMTQIGHRGARGRTPSD